MPTLLHALLTTNGAILKAAETDPLSFGSQKPELNVLAKWLPSAALRQTLVGAFLGFLLGVAGRLDSVVWRWIVPTPIPPYLCLS